MVNRLGFYSFTLWSWASSYTKRTKSTFIYIKTKPLSRGQANVSCSRRRMRWAMTQSPCWHTSRPLRLGTVRKAAARRLESRFAIRYGGHSYGPCTWEVEAGDPWLQSEFKASIDYMRPCLIKQNRKCHLSHRQQRHMQSRLQTTRKGCLESSCERAGAEQLPSLWDLCFPPEHRTKCNQRWWWRSAVPATLHLDV